MSGVRGGATSDEVNWLGVGLSRWPAENRSAALMKPLNLTVMSFPSSSGTLALKGTVAPPGRDGASGA